MRLTKPEVETFAQIGEIEEKIDFGGSYLVYSLQSQKDIKEISATFNVNKITVWMPESTKHEWTNSDTIGYEGKKDIGNQKSLYIVVEKDFACMDNTLEDQSDNYPNPKAVVC